MIDEELEKELKDYVNKIIYDQMERYRLDEVESITFMKQEIEGWLDVVRGYRQRMNQIEAMIISHSEGVQRVYDTLNSITDAGFINQFETSKKQLLEEIRSIKKTVNESDEFIKKCHKKMVVINDMYSMRDANPDLIKKMARINRAMHDIDEDEDL